MTDTNDTIESLVRQAFAVDLEAEVAFREVLSAVIREANANDVDVRGSWPIPDDDTAGWDVEVTDVSPTSTTLPYDSEFPAMAVLEVVADREGVDVTDLPALQDQFDLRILEALHRSPDESKQRVQFEYCGYRVTVYPDDSVVIDE
ncbi:HalOD1 output domain-containing protein [Halogeometricum luteum]|uniref:Halobacterial output domain-containing protein n=1 Tax=Halogeometricum luteum TaxID=2950537 RepID=A0ABU2G378_9EURY|nr:HalOD1 output domain-containing protein [Halogeometricum sp. S3BR5-2]MDS0295246.1 hypothetical protein [Halogeometricum sp. S3BR5-2]